MEPEVLISAEDLKERLDNDAVAFLFDLRNIDEFESWRIEGRSAIETLNIPQIRFVGEEERHLDLFPKDRQIIAVCAHGDSSRYAASLLREKGYDALSLEGGMDAWSEYYEVHRICEDPVIHQFYRVAKGCLSYLIASGEDAVVIDAVRHTDRVLGAAASGNLKIRTVLETHLQADHISGGRDISGRTGAAYCIHPGDCAGASFAYLPLTAGQVIPCGKSSIEVIPSPGHTPGSTSFLLDNKFLFSGDIIMKSSIGRPDLGGKADEWAALLYNTLFHVYPRLDDSTVVLPSHAASSREQDAQGAITTTLGRVRSESDLFKMKELDRFIGFVKSSLLENPERYQEIRKVNLGLSAPEEARKKELEIGKNLCGMAKK